MSAWGPEPSNNDLAQSYYASIAEREICPILIESVPCPDPEVRMQHLAYAYDRFRAAVQLMIILAEQGVPFSKGFFEVAIYKMTKLREDNIWFDCWSKTDSRKRSNYINSIDKQLANLRIHRDAAKP